MFPNAVMMKQDTWNHILGAMIAVRDAHGWREDEEVEEVVEAVAVELKRVPPAKRRRPKPKVKISRRVTKKPKKPTRKPKRAHAKVVRKAKTRKTKPAKKVVSKARPKVKSRKSKAGKKKTKRSGARKATKRKR